MKILGIDFGLKKIGLAISEGILVRPFGVIHDPEKFVSEIMKICRKEKIKKIVIGLSGGKMIPKTKAFSQEIFNKTNLPVVFQDETLTTRQAIVKMIEAGKSKKARKEKEDAFAAACILEEYLEKRRVDV